jgi:hypothetical protein
MAIDGGMRSNLEPGMRLVAKYKGEQHIAEVVEGEEGKVRFRLDGREFKSPSAAGSAVMGGQACNGWRFWSLAGADETAEVSAGSRGSRKGSAQKSRPAGTTTKTRKPEQVAAADSAEPQAEEAPTS